MQISSEVQAKNLSNLEPLMDSILKFSYNGNSYCMVKKGFQSSNVAMDMCKKQNATLPLPKSQEESNVLRRLTGAINIWIGIRAPTKGELKESWRDVEGYPVGTSNFHIYFRFKTFFFFAFFVISEPVQSGRMVSLKNPL